tara:strand:- start:21 stop:488 length:468 start_codon:yes stop_codon:yes gene_type:complete
MTNKTNEFIDTAKTVTEMVNQREKLYNNMRALQSEIHSINADIAEGNAILYKTRKNAKLRWERSCKIGQFRPERKKYTFCNEAGFVLVHRDGAIWATDNVHGTLNGNTVKIDRSMDPHTRSVATIRIRHANSEFDHYWRTIRGVLACFSSHELLV